MSTVSAATRVESVVIGTGVIGLAVARALSVSGKREVLLVDRANAIGSETSSRNSEVVHAGLYYPQDSYKTKFCVQGRKLLYDFCENRGVEYQKCGKLVVASKNQGDKLEALYHQSLKNEVSDVQLISEEQVKEMEPHVQAPGGALWSPSTGIVDSHAFMTSLLAEAEEQGATLALHSGVEDGDLGQGAYKIRLMVEGMWLESKVVVNCAGLWSDMIARMIHRHHHWAPPRQYFCKGNYFRLQGQKAPFSHLIYPLPDEHGGLGVHATLDLAGQVKFGPDVQWIDRDAEPDSIDLTPSSEREASFYESIRRYWPDLKDDTLVADYSGIRPKLQHPSMLSDDSSMPFKDFFIAGPAVHKVSGLVHLFGIESPGLTSAIALANHITNQELKE